MTLISPETDIAIAHANRAWTWFTSDRKLEARIPEWEVGTAADGLPLVSFQVVGPKAADALTLFAGIPEYLRALEADDIRPVFDYGVPGRVDHRRSRIHRLPVGRRRRPHRVPAPPQAACR